jgi:hypothetical protein
MSKTNKTLVLVGIGLFLTWIYVKNRKKSFSGTKTWYSDPEISGVPIYTIGNNDNFGK